MCEKEKNDVHFLVKSTILGPSLRCDKFVLACKPCSLPSDLGHLLYISHCQQIFTACFFASALDAVVFPLILAAIQASLVPSGSAYGVSPPLCTMSISLHLSALTSSLCEMISLPCSHQTLQLWCNLCGRRTVMLWQLLLLVACVA